MTTKLEDLIPIAVVIAAGCESCAEKMVHRAIDQGSPKPLIGRTLRIVARLRSLDCLAQAVGPEVIARMDKPLQAGEKALGGSCCEGSSNRQCDTGAIISDGGTARE
jgi:alkylhydroperoxidase/carboxymuconolactone decarboxylase family protein YurZ